MKIDDAKDILKLMQLPPKQQNDRCARVLLALCQLQERDHWKHTSDSFMRIHDIIKYIRDNYDHSYAENTRETIRKDAIKPFMDAAMVENNGKSTNSPNTAYRLTTETVELLRTYGTVFWDDELESYLKTHETLAEIYNQRKAVKQIPITINGQEAYLSLGVHNKLQKEILKNFASRFAQNSRVLYVGDSKERYLCYEKDTLESLGINVLEQSKLPDIILHRKNEDSDWIYFVEAVTSTGPMSPRRVKELKEFCRLSKCGLIFITAFLRFDQYKKMCNDLAWDTEVWIAEMPDHMIHLNGDKFLGPRD